MFKKSYKQLMEKIKPDDKLIENTIEKLKENDKDIKTNKSIYFKLANAVIVILIIFTFVWTYKINSPKREIEQIEDNSNIANLPTLDTFENLKQIAKNIKTQSKPGDRTITDSVLSKERTQENLSDVSNTNIQVQGVDEADIVKLDEKYVYYVAANYKIVIADVSNPSDINLACEIKYEENFMPQEIYLKDNRLIAIGTKYIKNEQTQENKVKDYYIQQKQYTKAIMYDITNKSDVKVLREVEIEGRYVSSRMIDNNIYLVSNKSIYPANILDDTVDPEQLKPEYRDTNQATEYKKIGYDQICYFPETEETNYLILASFNIYNNNQANIQTYLGGGDNIYCSQTSMYVVKAKYQHEEPVGEITTRSILRKGKTQIYKFNLINGNIAYKGKGEVEGTIINQFSMDENNNYFRIATTSFKSDQEHLNNIYILDDNLNTVGKLENLAKGESIYSVRFMQNKCYMVTFEQVDPLFVIDLQDPTNPKVLGELKIPGYSRYLHPYDENHIIGIGEEAENITENNQTRVITTGMKMALFDISDVNNPKQLYSTKIGEMGTYSEILYNHKALLFSKTKNIIAFPIYITQKANVTNKQELSFQGAIIYGLDLNTGFNLKGKISHMEIKNGYEDYDFRKAVNRIVYINDTLITISDSLIKTTNINTLETLDSIEITVEENNILYID